MVIRFLFLVLLFFINNSFAFAQIVPNKLLSVEWQDNSLIINASSMITYAESRLQDPNRVVVDILNSTFETSGFEKSFRSELGENISISEPTEGQVRVVFSGAASINRKSYLTNNEQTLVIRARIDPDEDESTISENADQSSLEKYAQGKLREITVEQDSGITKIIISATKSIKYNTYLLKNPDRFAIDLLNILPPDTPLPKYMSTLHISGLRVGRAASGVEATRVVVDLTKQNLDTDVDSNLLGNKLEIKFSINKQKEEIAKKSGIKVVIDPGHGGYDTGASYGGFEEKNINLIISEKLKKNLESSGIAVFLTRDDDSFLSLAERVEITRSVKPNVFISIHNNALVTSKGIRGVETYYWTPQSQKLASYVHKSVLSHINIPDHYTRRAKFYVIRHVSVPAILAELGFLSNREDRELLINSSIQDKYANALTDAILKFLDIEKEETAKGKSGEKKK